MIKSVLGAYAVARLAGIRYSRLDYWVRPERGNLIQCEGPAAGKGTRRTFGFLDIVRVRSVARLRSAGVSLQTIRRVLKELARYGETDPLIQTGRLVVAGDQLFWALDDATLLNVLTNQLAARPLVILPIGDIARDTARVLAKQAA